MTFEFSSPKFLEKPHDSQVSLDRRRLLDRKNMLDDMCLELHRHNERG